jgi:hypothetical protein
VQKYSTPIAHLVDKTMSQEQDYELGSPAYLNRRKVLVKDMFSRALGTIC